MLPGVAAGAGVVPGKTCIEIVRDPYIAAAWVGFAGFDVAIALGLQDAARLFEHAQGGLQVLLAVRLATVDRPRPFGVELRGSWARGEGEPRVRVRGVFCFYF